MNSPSLMDNLDFPSLQERLPSRIGLMFSEIASNYDRMNLLMTAGLDKRWRQEVIRHCHLKQGSRVLDLGTGTAELAIELAKFPKEFQVVGSDISLAMMFQGRKKPNAYEIGFTQANALILPFPDGSFDAVVSGFVMRNLPDQAQALMEQIRVLKSGGKIVFLDIVSPKYSLLPELYGFFFFRIVPFVGQMVTGSESAYSYLPSSTLDYPSPFALLQLMRAQGLTDTSFDSHSLATVSIHIGTKPQR